MSLRVRKHDNGDFAFGVLRFDKCALKRRAIRALHRARNRRAVTGGAEKNDRTQERQDPGV